MATLYGVQTTKRRNTQPAQRVDQGYDGGRVKVMSDKFTLSADLASGDFISMGRLPKGARVIDVRMVFPDLDAAGGTLDVGWQAGASAVEAADADGFLANVDVATAAGSVSMFEDQSTVPGMQKVFAEEVEVGITVDGDTDAAAGTIYLDVHYVID
jgi:hypothetical protein